MMEQYYIAAYTTSPSPSEWDGKLEARYFEALAKRPEIIGIELPFVPASVRYPADWLEQHVSEHWALMITTLPMFMGRFSEDPALGLVSSDEPSRVAAVALMNEVRCYAHALNQRFSRELVTTIHFHASPRNTDAKLLGSKEAFKQSLQDIKAMDWRNIQLNLEHCDAYVPGRVAEKGFLSLSDEIKVLSEAGGFGLVLNWARSAIEGRSAETPLVHIASAKAAGLLKGFFFSGCAENDKTRYGAWKDKHMPPQNIIDSAYLEKESLLSSDAITQVFDSLKDESVYLGVKVHDPAPVKPRNLDASVGLNMSFLEVLQAVRPL